MGFYPVLLDITGQLVLVIGGGAVAARKVASLLEAGAKVRLVAPELCPEARELAHKSAVEYIPRPFEPDDIGKARLVFCATGNDEVNRQAATMARKHGAWVNVIMNPEMGDFNIPAHIRRGDLLLAVGTGGSSPALSRRIRQQLEREFGSEWAPYLQILKAARNLVLAQGGPDQQNRELFYRLIDSDLLQLVDAGDEKGINALLASILGPGADLPALGLDPEHLWTHAEEAK